MCAYLYVLVQLQACALECYFLGNSVTRVGRMDVDATCVCMFLRAHSAKIRRINTLARKRRHAQAEKKRVFAQKQAQQRLLCSNNVSGNI